MKNTTLTKMIFTAVLALTLNAHAEFKMAYVDIQKAIQTSKAGKKAKADMTKDAEKKNKELEKKKADIEKIREDIEKKRSVLSEEAFAKKAQELQEEMSKFNQTAGKAQSDLAKRESELLAPIVEKMKKVIEKMAKEKGLTLVIQSNQNAQIVLYAAAEADLTEDVIKAFDKEK